MALGRRSKILTRNHRLCMAGLCPSPASSCPPFLIMHSPLSRPHHLLSGVQGPIMSPPVTAGPSAWLSEILSPSIHFPLVNSCSSLRTWLRLQLITEPFLSSRLNRCPGQRSQSPGTCPSCHSAQLTHLHLWITYSVSPDSKPRRGGCVCVSSDNTAHQCTPRA